MRRAALLAVLLVCILAGCRPKEEQKRVTVITVPEVAATGLPQQLARKFAAESHLPIDLSVVKPGDFARLLASGSGDVAIVGSDETLAAMRSASRTRLVQTFAYDDFIIAGPTKDPARVRHAATAADAFRAIAKRDQPFCSPVDVDGIHARESMIWTAAAIDPHSDRRYRACKGMAVAVLREAARRKAYTLTDRATFESVAPKLSSLLERTAMLHNDYTVVLMSENNRNADWFVQWLLSYRGRDVVESYRFEDGRRFYAAETD